MRKSRWSKVSALVASSVLALGLLAGCGGGSSSEPASNDSGGETSESSESSGASGDQVVKIGGIFDETGATGDVGAPYAEGARAYFEYMNSKGGFDGVKVELVAEDYAYDISRAQQVYQSLRDRHKVPAIIGWGTGDTEALRAQIIADQIPFISGSLSENLKDTKESAYNFLTAASYSDQGRAILEWIADNHTGNKPATVALVYDEGNPFSSSPMDDIKAYASENLSGEIEIVDDILIGLSDNDPQTTLQAYANSHDLPDYAIIQYTWNQTRNVIRAAHNLGWETQFIGTNWAAGEGLIPSGDDNQQWVEALDGTIAVAIHAFPFEEDLPGMAAVKEYLESKGKTLEDINQKFIQGWASASIYGEAIRIAVADKGGVDFNGADFKAAMEKINDLDLGGLAANVTFGPDKHWGTKEIRLAQLKDGKWEIITDFFSYEDLAGK